MIKGLKDLSVVNFKTIAATNGVITEKLQTWDLYRSLF